MIVDYYLLMKNKQIIYFGLNIFYTNLFFFFELRKITNFNNTPIYQRSLILIKSNLPLLSISDDCANINLKLRFHTHSVMFQNIIIIITYILVHIHIHIHSG